MRREGREEGTPDNVCLSLSLCVCARGIHPARFRPSSPRCKLSSQWLIPCWRGEMTFKDLRLTRSLSRMTS